MTSPPNPRSHYHRDHALLLIDSYRRALGRDLLPDIASTTELAAMLWHAPFIVASHDTQPDPVFNYANNAALALWEMTWEEFTHLPSRLSAEAVEQHERQRLLAAVSARGYIDDYSGIRMSKTGRRFRIVDATVWNVLDSTGAYRGQAVRFANWATL